MSSQDFKDDVAEAFKECVELRNQVKELEQKLDERPEQSARKLISEFRELLIQERLANTSPYALTDEERSIPFGTEYSRANKRRELHARIMSFESDYQKTRHRSARISKMVEEFKEDSQ